MSIVEAIILVLHLPSVTLRRHYNTGAAIITCATTPAYDASTIAIRTCTERVRFPARYAICHGYNPPRQPNHIGLGCRARNLTIDRPCHAKRLFVPLPSNGNCFDFGHMPHLEWLTACRNVRLVDGCHVGGLARRKLCEVYTPIPTAGCLQSEATFGCHGRHTTS